jgi:predicted RNA-binding protein with PUA-like domain
VPLPGRLSLLSRTEFGKTFSLWGCRLLPGDFGIVTIITPKNPNFSTFLYKRTGKATVAKKKSTAGGWLFKEEPSCYNYAQLEKDGSTIWAGVKNALARQYLRKIQIGDQVLYYSTGKDKAIVGEMRIVAGPTPDSKSDDPKSVVVTVAPVKRWEPPVTLAQIKADPFFADWELIRISRLSVMPVSAAQWQRLEKMCQESAIDDGTP